MTGLMWMEYPMKILLRALMLDGENFCSNDGCVSMANTLIAPVPREALAGNNLLEQLPYRQESSSTFN